MTGTRNKSKDWSGGPIFKSMEKSWHYPECLYDGERCWALVKLDAAYINILFRHLILSSAFWTVMFDILLAWKEENDVSLFPFFSLYLLLPQCYGAKRSFICT